MKIDRKTIIDLANEWLERAERYKAMAAEVKNTKIPPSTIARLETRASTVEYLAEELQNVIASEDGK